MDMVSSVKMFGAGKHLQPKGVRNEGWFPGYVFSSVKMVSSPKLSINFVSFDN
jgi:hypothetical protein